MDLPPHPAVVTRTPLAHTHVEARSLLDLFVATRRASERLASPLSAEDQLVQSMPTASPTKWHLAHTSWFFEQALLEPCGVPPFDERYARLFNSYYEALGPRHARPARGLLSRPSLAEIAAYRRHVDERVVELLESVDVAAVASLAGVVELGVAHEEQHQELILTDVLHALSCNPLEPVYLPAAPQQLTDARVQPLRFIAHEGGLHAIGRDCVEGFRFDNEAPRHAQWVQPFELADRLVTVAELKAFLRDDGYRTPALWLSEGIDWVRERGLCAPLYVSERDGELVAFGLHGLRVLRDDEPVSHLSYYEADALARYLGARLPTEAEWEVAAASVPVVGHFVEDGILHPRPAPSRDGVQQLFGDVWEWTASSYEPYPGFAPMDGALAEYNGKFMINQRVLRGGSCLSPARHLRASYRNFWHPDTRFQMSGVRVARSLQPR